MPRFSFLVFAALMVIFSACRTTAPIPQIRPVEPGLGACETTIETDGVTGNIRYVREGELTRQLWDSDGDGTIEVEVRKTIDGEGRVVEIERVDPTGEVVAHVEREYDGRRLVLETGDIWTEEGLPGPDGTPDYRHELEWRDGVLVEERFDELGADGLPGIDGDPEFVVTWTTEDDRRVHGERRHGDLVVAEYTLEWRGDELRSMAVDLGADGTIDERTEYEWSDGRVTAVATEGPRGRQVVKHRYCR